MAVARDVGLTRLAGFAKYIHPEEHPVGVDAPARALQEGLLLGVAEVVDGEGGVEDVGLFQRWIAALRSLGPGQEIADAPVGGIGHRSQRSLG